MNFITKIDINILNFIRENFGSESLDEIMTAITRLGDGGFVFIALTLAFLICRRQRILGKILALSLLANVILVNLIIKPLVGRIRPFDLVGGIDLLINKPRDYSFPSGHTAIAFAFLSVIIFFGKSKIFKGIILALAILMGLSRLYLYVHYPTDVIFGGLIGWLCGLYAKYSYEKGSYDKFFNKKIE